MISSPNPTRKLLILAQDPTVKVDGEILTTEVEVPNEILSAGPRGYRVYVVDYDASNGVLYDPAEIPVKEKSVEELLKDPAFHAQNAYAIVMRTLARFEFALGRRISWSFGGHQLHVAPHAFRDANAFYSKQDWGLFFGYFNDADGKPVFTCLSHDVVAHETTHAVLDGLRERYTFPSSPDQAAFHEGFADVVALLSIFSLPGVVEQLLIKKIGSKKDQFIAKSDLSHKNLRESALFGLGEQIDPRHDALRRSVMIKPDTKILEAEEYLEAHRRGEVFVAAMMNAFLDLWKARIDELVKEEKGGKQLLYRRKVADEGRIAADHLLTMAVRALDYAPSTDLRFSDYLCALLTADIEVQPDDSHYHYRDTLRARFKSYGINTPPPADPGAERGIWEPPDTKNLDYSQTHFDSLRQDKDEVFHFLWQNRKVLEIDEQAYTKVQSVRPCLRISSDGFMLQETVSEYVQILNLRASELAGLGLKKPAGMPATFPLTIYGGGVLIFGEYGQLKYHVRNKILNAARQNSRLKYLWNSGFLSADLRQRQRAKRSDVPRKFAEMHRLRNTDGLRSNSETEDTDADLF